MPDKWLDMDLNKMMHLQLSKKELQQYFVLSGIAIALGIISGFVAIGFRYLIIWVQSVFFLGGNPLDNRLGLLIIIVPAVGGIITGLITYYFAREAKGHGIPEVMEAVITKSGKIRPRVVLAKALASAITIGSGGSAGREGPIVQIGSAVGSFLAQKLKLPAWMIKVMVGCGASAALAATFNAPIAGVIFSLELIVPEFKTRSFIPLTISSVFGTVISRIFLEDAMAFPVPTYSLVHPVELVLYLVLGLLAGIAAVLLIKTLYHFEDVFDSLEMPMYVKPAIGGLLVGTVGLMFPQVLGLGYDTIDIVLNYSSPEVFLGKIVSTSTLFSPLTAAIIFLILFLLLKVLVSSLTIGSGGSGGVFVPSLFVGAMLGGLFGIVAGKIMPEGMVANPGAYALVAMAAMFAGVSRATLTSILILFEMTLNYEIILPLMFACVIADAVSILIYKDTIYTKKLVRKGIFYDYDREVSILKTVNVEEVMVTDVTMVKEEQTINEVSDIIIKTGYQAFPVLDQQDNLVGMIAHFDVRNALKEGLGDHLVKEVETRNLITISAKDDLEKAMEMMAFHGVGHLPVVNENEPDKLLGFLSRSDIMNITKSQYEDEGEL